MKQSNKQRSQSSKVEKNNPPQSSTIEKSNPLQFPNMENDPAQPVFNFILMWGCVIIVLMVLLIL